ncbi:type IV pilus modification PilV family protein [Bremerella sp. T1]|uniref:type IV pilus modification PilV family protein n=1 Tax=Bremerella sp. TYQ1 TaxID=3119568 RepID=UPI001CCB86EA|nr:type II secretion system protein [Bremerella volcania]UBM36545.1 type II secretion system GspH family protein [Bremerella volcania]
MLAHRPYKHGFTLIEVILALTVLAVSLAMLGQLVSLGFQNAQQAQGLTEAQMIAETIMEEIALGLIPPDPVTDMNVTMTSDLSTLAVEQDAPWLYSINWEPAPVDGLIMVAVQVRRAGAQSAAENDSFQIVRWMRDPELAVEELPDSSDGAPTELGGAI